eukprot:1142957-Pelagomonas_calceolata.AAC.2
MGTAALGKLQILLDPLITSSCCLRVGIPKLWHGVEGNPPDMSVNARARGDEQPHMLGKYRDAIRQVLGKDLCSSQNMPPTLCQRGWHERFGLALVATAGAGGGAGVGIAAVDGRGSGGQWGRG